jgi:hypothetical protein
MHRKSNPRTPIGRPVAAMRLLPVLLPLTTVVVAALSLRADEGLVAHWPLASDARDVSPNQLHAVNHGVQFEPTGKRASGDPAPDAPARGAAVFNGRTAYLEVPASPKLDRGTGNFSILTWVHTSDAMDDLPGDILSQYDPQTRTGFRLGIDSRPGVTSSQANWRNLHFGIDAGFESKDKAAAWTDHGRLGQAILIFSLAVHDDQLFAGTCEAGAEQAGRVFRYDGRQWTDCGAPDRCNAVCSLAVHEGKLYAGVGKYRLAGSSLTESENPHRGGTVYRYDGDNRWTSCGTLPDVEAINGMVVFRGQLYAGSLYAPAGFFRYEGGQRWTSCGTPEGKRVESLTVYNGHIYATGYDEGAVYRFDGSQWEHLGVLEGATQTYGFAVHHGDLFVSEWPHAKVFRYGGGKRWLPAGRLGEELETMPLLVYNGKMYAGTLPTAEVYRYDGQAQQDGQVQQDGAGDEQHEWTRIARLDFTPDVRYRRVWSMAVYRGRMFAGVLPSGHVHSVELGKNVTWDRPLPSGWRHVAAVRDEERLKLYVDGRLVGRSEPLDPATFNLSNNRPLRIGSGAGDYLCGRLRDLRIYGRALTESEIGQACAAK